MRIQAEAYYAIDPESEAVMRSKAVRSPDTCVVLSENDNDVLAYGLAYPFPAGKVPSLNKITDGPCISQSNLFLHDVAVDQRAAGRGLAKLLVGHLLLVADELGYETVSLVAIQHAGAFWSKLGFIVDNSVPIDASYAADAQYMRRYCTQPHRLNGQACT